jgi:hypothetical protein
MVPKTFAETRLKPWNERWIRNKRITFTCHVQQNRKLKNFKRVRTSAIGYFWANVMNKFRYREGHGFVSLKISRLALGLMANAYYPNGNRGDEAASKPITTCEAPTMSLPRKWFIHSGTSTLKPLIIFADTTLDLSSRNTACRLVRPSLAMRLSPKFLVNMLRLHGTPGALSMSGTRYVYTDPDGMATSGCEMLKSRV